VRLQKAIPLMLLTISLCACQTIQTRPQKEESKAIVAIGEYTRLAIESSEFSPQTILMLTEGYFKERSEMLKGGGESVKVDHVMLIGWYGTLIEKYPGNPAVAPLLYTLGYALYEQGDYDRAIKIFEVFTERYKTNPYFIEVCFRLGELYFDTGQYGEAKDAYVAALSSPSSIFYERSLYKMGWTYYKLEMFNDAVNYFSQVVDRYNGADLMSESLAQESIFNIARCLVRIKDIKEREGIIERLKTKIYAPRIILELGKMLIEETEYEEAISVHTLFVSMFPQHPSLPNISAEMAKAYEWLKEEEKAVELREAIVEKYNPTTDWYKKNYPNGNRELDTLVAETLMALSQRHHATGNEKKAIEGYKRLMAYFPEFPAYKDAQIILAEALFDAKNYREAAEYYIAAMDMYKGRIESEKAAYGAVLSYELMASDATGDKRDIAIAIKKLADSIKDGSFNSSAYEDLLYRVAAIYSAIGLYHEARELLSPLLKRERLSIAYQRIGDTYFAENNLPEAIAAYTSALRYSNSDRDIRSRLSGLHNIMAANYVKEGRFKEAVEHHLSVSSIAPDTRLAEESLVSAGLLYVNAGDTNGFKNTLELLKKSHTDSKGTIKLLIEAGKILEERGEVVEGVSLFEEAAILSKESEDTSAFIIKSLAILEEHGDYQHMEALIKRYLSKTQIQPNEKMYLLYMLGAAQLLSGKQEGIDTLTSIAKAKDTPENHPYIAKARLKLADIRLDTFLKKNIEKPFEESLKAKGSLMKELLGEYGYLIKTGIPELLPEASYKIGLVFENFKDSLLNSEKPEELSSEELAEYNFLLEERAYPIEEQAVNAYDRCIKASVDLNIKKEFVQKCRERLSALRPVMYKRDIKLINIRPLFIPLEPIHIDNLQVSNEAIRHFNDGFDRMASNPSEAIANFRLALEKEPLLSEVYYNIGVLLYRLKDKEGAFAEFSRAFEKGQRLAEVYDAFGMLYMEEGEMHNAIDAYKNALSLRNLQRSMIHLANIYLMEDNLELAFKYFREAEGLGSDNPYLNYNMAILLLKKNEVNRAVERLKKAAALKDTHPEIAIFFAKALLLKGEVNESIKLYNTTIEILSDQPEAYRDLGIIYELYKKDSLNALKSYMKYIALGGKDEAVRHWADLLNSRLGGIR